MLFFMSKQVWKKVKSHVQESILILSFFIRYLLLKFNKKFQFFNNANTSWDLLTFLISLKGKLFNKYLIYFFYCNIKISKT